jgi:hypothetical protein
MCQLEESRNGYSRVQFLKEELDKLQFPYLSMKVDNSVSRILNGQRINLPHIDFNHIYVSDAAVILANFEKRRLYDFVEDALHTMILEEASYTKRLASLNDRRKWRTSIKMCRKYTPLRTATIPDAYDLWSTTVSVRTILYLPCMEDLPD